MEEPLAAQRLQQRQTERGADELDVVSKLRQRLAHGLSLGRTRRQAGEDAAGRRRVPLVDVDGQVRQRQAKLDQRVGRVQTAQSNKNRIDEHRNEESLIENGQVIAPFNQEQVQLGAAVLENQVSPCNAKQLDEVS